MLTATTIGDTDVVEIGLDGPFDAAAMTAVHETIDAVVARHGHVRLLATVDDVGRIEPKAALEDLRTAKLLDKVTKYALLTDAGWIDKVAKAGSAVVPVDGRVFGRGERDEAVAWLTS